MAPAAHRGWGRKHKQSRAEIIGVMCSRLRCRKYVRGGRGPRRYRQDAGAEGARRPSADQTNRAEWAEWAPVACRPFRNGASCWHSMRQVPMAEGVRCAAVGEWAIPANAQIAPFAHCPNAESWGQTRPRGNRGLPTRSSQPGSSPKFLDYFTSAASQRPEADQLNGPGRRYQEQHLVNDRSTKSTSLGERYVRKGPLIRRAFERLPGIVLTGGEELRNGVDVLGQPFLPEDPFDPVAL
jgi:hypothetical protein